MLSPGTSRSSGTDNGGYKTSAGGDQDAKGHAAPRGARGQGGHAAGCRGPREVRGRVVMLPCRVVAEKVGGGGGRQAGGGGKGYISPLFSIFFHHLLFPIFC